MKNTTSNQNTLTSEQSHRVSQILGFVNHTLKHLPVRTEKGIHEMEASLIIQAATYQEKDQQVLDACHAKFKEWYNYTI